jgi:hypothetical protein
VSGAAGRSAEVLRARGGVGVEVGTVGHEWQSHIYIYIKNACSLAEPEGLALAASEPDLSEPELEVRFRAWGSGPDEFSDQTGRLLTLPITISSS